MCSEGFVGGVECCVVDLEFAASGCFCFRCAVLSAEQELMG
ncbi:hypothetical protein M3J09_009028 [Ascochyta lentis]